MIWVPLLVTAGLLADATRLRARLAPLRRVPPPARGGTPPAWDSEREAAGTYGLISAEGARLPGRSKRAALAHTRDRGLQILDLIPADLPVTRALDLARSVGLDGYRTDPLALGRGAGFVTVVEDELLERAGIRPGPLDTGEYAAATVRLRQYARPCPEGFAADMAVIPCHLSPRAPACQGRAAWLRGLGVSVSRTIACSVLGLVLVLAALSSDLRWGPLAVIAYCAVPYIVFLGTPISPRDLHRMALLRPVLTPWTWWRTLADPPSARDRECAEREAEARDAYRREYAQGVKRFLGQRREDCPWCGSHSLRRQVTSGDILQRKPGRFTLERCRACGHVFQNPRLTEAGLNFYYRDVYDGLGIESTERVFAIQGDKYRARAEMVGGHFTPRSWLDVGTGHAHFCRMAQTVLPETCFDGLDLGAGVEEAARRGWVRHAYRGLFPSMVEELTGRYDVISMHHYLEHTLDPEVELDAAVKVLRPGGHLLIELPDPESCMGRLLGRFWAPWIQPQHLNMMPIRNLERTLAARGLHIVASERRGAHIGFNLVLAVSIAVNAFGPRPDRPWAPRRPTSAAWARHVIAMICGVLLLAPAFLLDKLVVPLIPGGSDAYRVLARKEEG